MSSPNIVLVTLDTMRADRVGRERHGARLTPNLTSFAAGGLAFTRAVAAGVPTYFSFPAIFLGGLALDSGKTIGLACERPSFVEALKAQGYRTAAVVAWNPYLSRHYGYDRGFDVFDDFYSEESATRSARDRRAMIRALGRILGENGLARLRRLKDKLGHVRECFDGGNPAMHEASRGEAITERGLGLAKDLSGDRPFFLWLHYMDLHGYFYATWDDRFLVFEAEGPIDRAVLRYRRFRYVDRWGKLILASEDPDRARPVEHGARDGARDRIYLEGFYDAAVRYTDRSLRPLFEWAEASGDTVVIVTSDHGEEFFEHGRIGHAPFGLYDEIARVPLIVRGPGIPAREVTDWVSHSSIAPTVLELAQGDGGFGPAPSLLAGAPSEGPTFTETLEGAVVPFPKRRLDGFDRLISARDGRFKYVWREGGDDEFFDICADSEESVSLIDEAAYAGDVARLKAAAEKRAREIGVADARAKLADRTRVVASALGVP